MCTDKQDSQDAHEPGRKEFLATSVSCAAHLAMVGPWMTPRLLSRWQGLTQEAVDREAVAQKIVAQEPFGRIERLGEGLYAMISTPLEGDRTTLCNGGIIQGTSGTVIVESFASPEGGRWMAEKARELTGRWPTHVIVTHYHGDHSAGAAGFTDGPESAELRATASTRDQVVEGLQQDGSEAAKRPWADVVLVPDSAPTTLDIGGRELTITPHEGHTDSDLTIQVSGGPVWCGDLVWNGMFPNYMDARPSRLSAAVRQIAQADTSQWVPGHGPMATQADIGRYLEVIDHVEAVARDSHRRGIPAGEAAESFELPDSAGEWMLFNPAYFRRALQAWMDELG